MDRGKGFTLMELMMTVVIVGVLAAIAIPSYGRTRERAYWREAQDLLLVIYYGERAYFLTNTKYQGLLGKASGMDAWRTIFMDDPHLASIPMTFTVTTPTPTTFEATASRDGGTCGSWTRTINHNRAGTWSGGPPC